MKQNHSTELVGYSSNIYSENDPPDHLDPNKHFFPDFLPNSVQYRLKLTSTYQESRIKLAGIKASWYQDLRASGIQVSRYHSIKVSRTKNKNDFL